jgi:pimeloyl-ACP methyl ester carboxylesterase
MQPDTRYASSGDVHIAYQVTGEGPVDLVMAPGTASHLDLDWEWPEKADFLKRLGSFCRLIRFDKRGTGLSDRPTDAATLEERTDDIRAVMDAAGTDRAFIFGYSEGANLAALFGATYPERTRGLLLWGAQARWTRADDYPWGVTRAEYDREIAYLAENGATLEYLTGPGAGIPKDLRVKLFMRYLKASASPAALAALERLCSSIGTRRQTMARSSRSAQPCVFDGPGRAIACASTIAASVRDLGLEVRAGVHTGECELAAGNVSGIAVHTGARIAALAAPNEVLVSGTVHDLVAGSKLRFETRGTHALKGVPGEWRIFSVPMAPDHSATAASAPPAELEPAPTE